MEDFEEFAFLVAFNSLVELDSLVVSVSFVELVSFVALDSFLDLLFLSSLSEVVSVEVLFLPFGVSSFSWVDSVEVDFDSEDSLTESFAAPSSNLNAGVGSGIAGAVIDVVESCY